MPTNRRYTGHRAQGLGPLEVEHLGSSGRDHLLAGDCRLCRDGIHERDWREGREAVRHQWQRLGFPFPPLAAILFDGERFPPERDPAWRDLHKWTWTMIADELVALAPYNLRDSPSPD